MTRIFPRWVTDPPPLVRALLVVLAAITVGCGFAAQPTSGVVACKPQGDACCPDGYLCVGRTAAAAGTCWRKQDLPTVAFSSLHDFTPAVTTDPACLVTDWLPPGPPADGSPLDPGPADAAPPPPTGTGGSGGRFPDAPWGPEITPDTADAPITGDVRDAPSEPRIDIAAEPSGVDGAAPDAAGRLDAPADLRRADVAADARFNSGGVVTAIAAGGEHTCAVVNGSVWCWGANEYGQLGDNTTSTKYAPVSVAGLQEGGATAVAASYGHSCAVVNGGVQCWGYNVKGQLGNGSNFSSQVPVPVVGLESGVTAIAAAFNVSCAVVNGGMQCWGEGLDNGGTIDNYRNVPIQVGGLTSGVSAIATDGGKACAVVNGGLFCWSSWWQLPDKTMGWQKAPELVAGFETGVTAVTMGGGTVCAVVNGGVKCWGEGSEGELGNGTTTDSKTPVQVTGLTDGVTAVSLCLWSTRAFACALAAGAVYCWGNNEDYQLGDGSGVGSSTPVRAVGLAGVTLLSVGDSHACASTGIGLSCWGFNNSGAIGGQDFTMVKTPRAVAFP